MQRSMQSCTVFAYTYRLFVALRNLHDTTLQGTPLRLVIRRAGDADSLEPPSTFTTAVRAGARHGETMKLPKCDPLRYLLLPNTTTIPQTHFPISIVQNLELLFRFPIG